MQLRIRQLISLLGLVTFVLAGACNQSNPPADAPSSARSIGGGAEHVGLAEAILTILLIARKQAQDSGECAHGDQRLDRRSGEDRALKQFRCDPLGSLEAKRVSSEPDLR